VCDALVSAVPELTPVSLLMTDFMPPIDIRLVQLKQEFPEPLEKGIHVSKLYYGEKQIWSKKTTFYKDNGRLGSSHDARLLGDSQVLVFNEAWYTGKYEKFGQPSNKTRELQVVDLLLKANVRF